MVALLALAAPGCGDDDAPEQGPGPPDPHGIGDTTTTLAAGDLQIDPPSGFSAIPLPALGVGLAIPEGWEAVVLTDEALDRIEELGIVPGFVDAARNARRSGAVFYAAGPDPGGGVADLKLQPVPSAESDAEGPDADALRLLGEAALAAAPEGAELDEQLDRSPPRLRIRYAVTDGAVEAEGTQWLVAGPTQVWSIIVTSEDAGTHDDLAEVLVGAVVFSGS